MIDLDKTAYWLKKLWKGIFLTWYYTFTLLATLYMGIEVCTYLYPIIKRIFLR